MNTDDLSSYERALFAIQVCAQLHVGNPKLFRYAATGSTYLTDTVVVCVTKNGRAPLGAGQLLALSTFLTHHQVSSTMPKIMKLFHYKNWTATVWQKVPHIPGAVDADALFRTLQTVWDCDPAQVCGAINAPIPPLTDTPRRLLERLDILDDTTHWLAADLLRCKVLSAAGKLEKMWPTLDLVVCHGDVNRSNVLWNGSQVTLCDWENLQIGPKEWDLVVPDAQAVLGVQKWTDFDRNNTREEVWDVCAVLRTLDSAIFALYSTIFCSQSDAAPEQVLAWLGQ